MKRGLLCIMLVVSLALTAVMPTTALAAKGGGFVPFYAAGTILGITPGDVFPAGDSGRWVVAERDIFLFLVGDASGLMTVTYKANVGSAFYQDGTFHGSMDAGLFTLKVRGKTPPAEWVGINPLNGNWYFQLDLEGKWTMTNGAQGNGIFQGAAVFEVDPDEGHIVGFDSVQSSFVLTGEWKPVLP